MTALSNLLKSWTFRWALLYLLIAVIASGAVIGYLFWRTNNLLTDQVLQTLASEVNGLREQFQVGGRGLLRATVAERARAPGNGIYLLVDPRGQKLAGNINRVPPELRDPRGGPFSYRRERPGGDAEDRIGVGIPIRVQGGSLLIVARDVQDQRNFARTSRRILIWGVVVIGLIGLGGGFLVSRNILRRIDSVTATSRTIMGGNLSERIPLNGSGDELDRLAQSLNAMLDRIEQLMTGMREVSDNIAHDLKTPLNRLRNRVERALRDPSGDAAHRDALEATIDEADGLIKTFNALLSIARLEAGAAGDNMEPVNLADVVRDVAELYEPLADEAGIGLVTEKLEPFEVVGDRQLFGQALSNLIDNAIKYAGDGAGEGPGEKDIEIALSVRRLKDHAEILVADNGPGIPAGQRERVLQRFVRLEASRSRPGSGLGLSLVSAVARLHGGDFRLEDGVPGLRAILTIPLSPEDGHA